MVVLFHAQEEGLDAPAVEVGLGRLLCKPLQVLMRQAFEALAHDVEEDFLPVERAGDEHDGEIGGCLGLLVLVGEVSELVLQAYALRSVGAQKLRVPCRLLLDGGRDLESASEDVALHVLHADDGLVAALEEEVDERVAVVSPVHGELAEALRRQEDPLDEPRGRLRGPAPAPLKFDKQGDRDAPARGHEARADHVVSHRRDAAAPVVALRHPLHALAAEFLADVGLVEGDRGLVLDEADPIGTQVLLRSEIALREPAREPLLDSLRARPALAPPVHADALRVPVPRKTRKQGRALSEKRREKRFAGLPFVFAAPGPEYIPEKRFLRAFEFVS